MKEYRKYLSLMFGLTASYLYLIALGIADAYVPIQPSALLLARCANETVSNVSSGCRMADLASITAYGALTCVLAAISVVMIMGLLQRLLCRFGYPAKFSLFVAGFLVGWVVLIPWSDDFKAIKGRVAVVNLSVEIAVFIFSYLLVAKYLSLSRNKPLMRTPGATRDVS